jgi:hypothetical protein
VSPARRLATTTTHFATQETGAENGIFFELSLCLSRACLGKRIVFIYKWLKNAVFRRLFATLHSLDEDSIALNAGVENTFFGASFIVY